MAKPSWTAPDETLQPDQPTQITSVRRRAALLDDAAHFAVADHSLLQGSHPDGLAAHFQRYGPRPSSAGRQAKKDLFAAVTAAGLTGHGGAHFPVTTKWRAALSSPAAGTVVIANGAESEPLSAKDAALLRLRPHLMLDGLVITAEVLGAEAAVIWLNESAVVTQQAVTWALDERRAAGLSDVPVHIRLSPDRYVSGQSSAVVHALEGGPALPAFTRFPSARHGIHGRPTVIHNIETLARVSLIARGVTGELAPGALVTVAGPTLLSVCEAGAASTVAEAVDQVMPSPDARQAVLIGGYGGSWLSWADAKHQPLNRIGPRLGPGVLAPLPANACGIAETAAMVNYLARASAQQCGPCQFGTRALADLLIRLARGGARWGDGARLRRLCAEVDGRGACGLPDGAVQLIRSALDVFAGDVQHHLRRKRCRYAKGARTLHVPGEPA